MLPAHRPGFAYTRLARVARCKADAGPGGAVGITVVGLVIGGVFVIRDGAKAKAHRLDGSIARHQLLKHIHGRSRISRRCCRSRNPQRVKLSESSDYFSIEVCGTDAKQYADYVKSVQDNGFTVTITSPLTVSMPMPMDTV